VKKIAYLFFLMFLLSGCSFNLTDKSVVQSKPVIVTNVQGRYYTGTDSSLENEMVEEESIEDFYDINMKRDLLCLIMAYPEFITGFERDTGGKVYVVMKSGKKILYDDKIPKNYEQKLVNADLQDAMEMLYPLLDISELLDDNYDPGRIRCYDFLKEIYGASRQQIEKNLKGVNIGGKVCQFNDKNMAATALKKAAEELSLSAKNSKISSQIFPVNGTYNYRVIAGTNQLSPHAFGIAIDFKSDKRDYWKWATRELGQQRLNTYPREVVKIMEENNFIWGGKWTHFDILHFEYRPELITKAKYHVEEFERAGPWYYGFPTGNDIVKSYIELIDSI